MLAHSAGMWKAILALMLYQRVSSLPQGIVLALRNCASPPRARKSPGSQGTRMIGSAGMTGNMERRVKLAHPNVCYGAAGLRAERAVRCSGLRGNLGDRKLKMSYFPNQVRNKLGELLAEVSADEMSCLDFQMGYS